MKSLVTLFIFCFVSAAFADGKVTEQPVGRAVVVKRTVQIDYDYCSKNGRRLGLKHFQCTYKYKDSDTWGMVSSSLWAVENFPSIQLLGGKAFLYIEAFAKSYSLTLGFEDDKNVNPQMIKMAIDEARSKLKEFSMELVEIK